MLKIRRMLAFVALAAALTALLCACGGKEQGGESGNIGGDDSAVGIESMSCEQIIKSVYERCGSTEFFERLKENENALITKSIEPDGGESFYSCSYYFGTSIDFAEAAASEPDSQPPAYSFCVAIMPEGCDMDMTAKAVRDNADPDKWVCTGVSTVYVETVGSVLALIMADEQTADALKAAFLSLGD